jgi:hypothetical protein
MQQAGVTEDIGQREMGLRAVGTQAQHVVRLLVSCFQIAGVGRARRQVTRRHHQVRIEGVGALESRL